MDYWKSSFNKVNATNAIARAGTQKQDERYNRVTRISPPADPVAYTPPQQYPPQLGENASYYAPQPTSPFSPATQAPVQPYEAFIPPPGWNQGYAHTQQPISPPPPAQPNYFPENVNPQPQPQSQPQPQYQYNQYPLSPPQGSPPAGHAQPYVYDTSGSQQPQGPTMPLQRSQTDFPYPSPPAPLGRSYTTPAQPVAPHNCNDYWEPILARCRMCNPTQRHFSNP